jgi:hypothetical protein
MADFTVPFHISPLNFVDSFLSGSDQYISAELVTEGSRALAESGGVGMLSEVMNYCQKSSVLKVVHRIAVVRRLGVTNQLRLECSIKDETVSEELMKKNYTCYVRKDSSIFKLTPGIVRVYHDVEMVKKSFHNEHSPIQRSIQKIGEMGLVSGLCVPLFVYGNIVGFAFANSMIPNAFDLSYSQKQLAHALQILGIALLNSAGSLSFQYLAAADSNEFANAAAPLSPTLLATSLKAYRQNWDFREVTVRGGCQAKILHNQGTMLYVIALLTRSIGETPKIEIMPCIGEEVVIKLYFSAQNILFKTIFDAIKLESSFLGVEIRRINSTYFLSQQIDYWKDESVTYSVA